MIRFLTLFVLLTTHFATAETLWQVGVAKTIITPESNMWMAGYSARKAPADGKLTDLWAKALVLDDGAGNRGVIITLDIVGIDRITAGEICTLLKTNHQLNREQIIICTSHTHSGPVVGKNLKPLHYLSLDAEQQKLIETYAEVLVEKITTLVSTAMTTIEPARMQWGSGKATFAVNRRENKPYTAVIEKRSRGELAGPVDHDVPVLSVRNAEGKIRAVLFGYACHATVLGLQKWCGDYPGYAQIEIEKANPDCIALFWAGCGGDQNPLPRKSIDLAKKYGAELAEAVEEVLTAPMSELPATLATHYREIDLALASLPTKSELTANVASTNRFEVARSKILLRQMEKKGAIDGSYPYPVSGWKIGGEIDFIALGGEVVIDYALRLKRERHDEKTWVAGYSNDVMAYIPSLRVLKEGGYEGGKSNVYYGLPGLWSEAVEETIMKAVSEISPR